MPSNFEQLVFEIIATDRNASAAFDRFRQKVDQTSRSVDDNTSRLDKNARSIDNLGKDAAQAAGKGGLADLIGSGGGLAGGGMAGLVAAGVALSPVIATVGTGLGGLALAAYGAVKPIETAAQKTGGLRANMASLNPEQQKLAVSVLALQKQYGAFEKALQPEVLTVFGKGISLAGHLMRDVQPVAQATGKAIGGFLDRVDAELQSGTWKSFFSWMSAQVGPDIQMIGTSIVDLVDALPPLLQSLQPVALQLLQFVDDGAKLIDVASRVNLRVQSLGHTASTSGGLLGMFAGAAKRAFNEMVPGVQGAQQLEHWLGKLGSTTNTAAAAQAALNNRVAASHAATADLIHPVGTLTGGLQSAKAATDKEKNAVQQLTTALNIMNGGLLTTQQDNVTWKQSLQNATQALHQNKGALDDHSKAGLADRSAVIQSTQAALNFAGQQVKTGHDTDGASKTLQAQIKWLQEHAGHSKFAQQEIDALRAALQKLKNMGNINTTVNVIGHGRGGISFQDQIAGQRSDGTLEFHAKGARIPGYGGGDIVPAMLEPGETVVPKHLTAMVAPLMKAYGVPGFAAGGLIGNDTVLTRGIGYVSGQEAQFMRAAIRQGIRDARDELQSMTRSVSVTSGALGGDAAANEALARRIFPWGASQWPAFVDLVMAESGFNRFARNPTSGAYGIAQALPPTKYPFAGQAAGGSHAGPQLSWMFDYIRGRYGYPMNAWAHETAFHWYDQGGYLPPGLTLAYNGTGKPEPVGAAPGNTYNITVNVPPSANKADTGRVIVEHIREFERRSGPGWRK